MKNSWVNMQSVCYNPAYKLSHSQRKMHIKYGFGLKNQESVKRVRRIDIDHLWNMENGK